MGKRAEEFQIRPWSMIPSWTDGEREYLYAKSLTVKIQPLGTLTDFYLRNALFVKEHQIFELCLHWSEG